MAFPTIEKPRLNPIQFVDADPPVSNRYHTRHMLEDWYFSNIREWEAKQGYTQKFQLDDFIRLQFHASANSGISLQVLTCRGRVLATLTPSLTVTLAGNIEPFTGLNQALTTYQFNFQFSDVSGIAEGVYYLAVKVLDGATVKHEVSEPIYIAQSLPQTVLISYYCEKNEHNTVFEQTGVKFGIRVEGSVGNYTPAGTGTVYVDQKDRHTLVNGKPSRTFTLFVEQVPDYLIDKLDSITLCDHWQVDKVEYVINDGDKWEKAGTGGVPLSSASLTIREKEPDRATFTITPGALKLFTLPLAYPYAISSIKMGEVSPNIPILPAPLEITGAGGVTALITALNAARGAYGLTGTFSTASGDVIYTNGVGEYYVAAQADIRTSFFSLELSNITGPYSVSFIMRNGALTVAWGDGAATNHFAFLSNLTVEHDLPTGTTFTVRIYGGVERFIFSDDALTDFGGVVPAAMQLLSLTTATQGLGLTSFNAAILAPAATTITSLSLIGMQIASLSGLGTTGFTKLSQVNVSGNKLSQAFVSLAVTAMKNIAVANSLYSGQLFVNGQVPPVTLTLGGTLDKSVLVNSYGWTVVN